eukprot:CAMPEP_0119563868 /NCGR_PEP_ID=MMETSP1352-20130426/25077_1 /TAXON_ID=265584 /ORGANISM="Stauroneis constricta, Strain CCMP1120" /LENGTH=42 /DNA_ID= /DNA_START= /DNA_END= /DNA_ORIENTATION=
MDPYLAENMQYFCAGTLPCIQEVPEIQWSQFKFTSTQQRDLV